MFTVSFKISCFTPPPPLDIMIWFGEMLSKFSIFFYQVPFSLKFLFSVSFGVISFRVISSWFSCFELSSLDLLMFVQSYFYLHVCLIWSYLHNILFDLELSPLDSAIFSLIWSYLHLILQYSPWFGVISTWFCKILLDLELSPLDSTIFSLIWSYLHLILQYSLWFGVISTWFCNILLDLELSPLDSAIFSLIWSYLHLIL